MSLEPRLLGRPFADNALFVRLDCGQRQFRFLFDCGDNTLQQLSDRDVQRLDHLFISHFHLDHVAGLDHFIRLNYNRYGRPVHLWGPPGAVDKLVHRLNSFSWNLLTEQLPTTWLVHEVGPQSIRHVRLLAAERFGIVHELPPEPFNGSLLSNQWFEISVVFLEHKIPVLGFCLQEGTRWHIDSAKLQRMGLESGPWLNYLKDFSLPAERWLKLGARHFTLGQLRRELLVPRPGQKLVYLTDFTYNEQPAEKIARFAHQADYFYCETQFLAADVELADRHCHLTTTRAARLAQAARVQTLFPLHFSRRYHQEQLAQFLEEIGRVFPLVQLSEEWLKSR